MRIKCQILSTNVNSTTLFKCYECFLFIYSQRPRTQKTRSLGIPKTLAQQETGTVLGKRRVRLLMMTTAAASAVATMATS